MEPLWLCKCLLVAKQCCTLMSPVCTYVWWDVHCHLYLCCSNSADKVVNGKGKFEELIVYSKDIAASTAQLVAASRVKARAKSEKLAALKGASKKGRCTEGASVNIRGEYAFSSTAMFS